MTPWVLELTILWDSVNLPKCFSDDRLLGGCSIAEDSTRVWSRAGSCFYYAAPHDTEPALPYSRKIYKMHLESSMSLLHGVFNPSFRNLELDRMSHATFVGLV